MCEIKTGDIVGFSGRNWPSILINCCTYGIPFCSISHVGIIGEYKGEQLLFESTTLSDLPCVIQGQSVRGVHAVRLADYLDTYRGHFWHYPLYRPLYQHEEDRLNQFLLDHVGRDYDYIGALRAGGVGFSWLESLLHEEDLRFIFCSELCAAAHNQIGLLLTANVSRWSPNLLVRYERRQCILRRPRRLQ